MIRRYNFCYGIVVFVGVKEEPLVTTLSAVGRGGRGGRRRKAGGRGGGVVTRRSRLSNRLATNTPSADVYEFRDDSEEETGRPRLILTIKSPPEPPPTCTTRKSRRLLVCNFLALLICVVLVLIFITFGLCTRIKKLRKML